MVSEVRLGRQTPTVSVILPYEDTHGSEAIELYEASGRESMEWQQLLTYDLLSVNASGLYVHTRFGYSIPRRNGKGEILTIRELYGLQKGERGLHTAHRTTTSSSAAKRLVKLLEDGGYTEVLRPKKGDKYEKSFTFSKQYGLEKITMLDTGGSVDFRTRTSAGGLGEGFDYLIVDEAQEYTDDQDSTLKYTVSDSMNPQIIMCGTPPTAVSTGTVFTKYRQAVIDGGSEDCGWAEWSVEHQADVYDVNLWYECNPSMGVILNERKVKAEIGKDLLDFNIQRLGLWVKYNQKSAISSADWEALRCDSLPALKGRLFAGVKYGKNGENVALSIAVKTEDGRVFVEAIDCRPTRSGNGWIIAFLKASDVRTVVIDGANGQNILAEEMRRVKLRNVMFPKVSEVIDANALFEQAIYSEEICHMGQPSLTNVITNCERRAIGSNSGYGFRAIREETESALMDSAIFAFWACKTTKEERRKQVVNC